MKTRKVKITTCLIILVCISMVSTSFAYANTSETKRVFITSCESAGSCFSPCQITVIKGDTVTWINLDSRFRMITSGSGQSGPDGWFSSSFIPPHQMFSHTFDRIGSFVYYDNLHPHGEGVVIVGSTVDSPYVHLQQSYFSHWCSS